MLRYRPKLMYTQPDASESDRRSRCRSARAASCIELAERYRVPIVEDDTYRELSLVDAAAAVAVRARRDERGRHPI